MSGTPLDLAHLLPLADVDDVYEDREELRERLLGPVPVRVLREHELALARSGTPDGLT